jgi:hypothetical protein
MPEVWHRGATPLRKRIKATDGGVRIRSAPSDSPPRSPKAGQGRQRRSQRSQARGRPRNRSLLQSPACFQRIDITRFGHLDRDHHNNGQLAAGIRVKRPRISRVPPRHSTTEVLRHLRKLGEFSPTRQHESISDDNPHDQRSRPCEVRCDARRQQNEKIDDEFRGALPRL